MTAPAAEFDFAEALAMIVVKATCLFAIASVAGVLVLLIRYFLWYRRPASISRTMSAGPIQATAGHAPTVLERDGRRIAIFIPLIVFFGVAMALAFGITRDPSAIPSALIGKPVPEFALPPVKGRAPGLASANLKGEVSLVNVFASWCTACREEHPMFMQLRAAGVVPIHGLDYKDQSDDAARWLNTMGDPYARTGADVNGRVAIDWGVYGVPETFVITKDGHIAHKHIGAMTPEVLRDTIMPLIRKLREQ